MIRPLRWNDMDDLVENYYSYYDEVKNENPELGLIFHDNRPDLVHEAEWFSSLFSDVLKGDAVAYVAEEDGRAVGMCDVHRKMPGSEVSHTGVLGISIARDYRNRGLGRKLLNAMLEECRGKFEAITLAVFESNHYAVRLYREMGFVEYGKFKHSVKRNGKYFDELLLCYRY